MQPCACRDCMEITAAAPKAEIEEIYNEESEDYEPVTTVTLQLCRECEEAGCEPCPGRFEMSLGDPFKCQRSDTYSGSGTDDPEDARWEAEHIQPHPRVWPNYIDNP